MKKKKRKKQKKKETKKKRRNWSGCWFNIFLIAEISSRIIIDVFSDAASFSDITTKTGVNCDCHHAGRPWHLGSGGRAGRPVFRGSAVRSPPGQLCHGRCVLGLHPPCLVSWKEKAIQIQSSIIILQRSRSHLTYLLNVSRGYGSLINLSWLVFFVIV